MDDLMERVRAAMEEYEESSETAMASSDSVVSALGRRLHRYHQAHRKILDWAQRRNCADGEHLLSPPDPDELVEALAEAYRIEP